MDDLPWKEQQRECFKAQDRVLLLICAAAGGICPVFLWLRLHPVVFPSLGRHKWNTWPLLSGKNCGSWACEVLVTENNGMPTRVKDAPIKNFSFEQAKE